MPLSLALDLGTTSIAAAAIDEEGRTVAVEKRANDSAVAGLPAGHAEQDPLRLRTLAFETLAALSRRLADEPAALALTGQMHGILLLDGGRRPLTNLITWQDRRATESYRASGRSVLEEFLARCPESALEDTGCRPAPGYGAVTLFALGAEQRRQARHACVLADWVAAELADAEPATDRSNAASLGVYDLRHDGWSEALLAAAEVEAGLLPAVPESGEPLGGICGTASQSTGLPAGLPVLTPIGDNQAAYLGGVPAGESAVQINIGTGGQIGWAGGEFRRLPGLETRYLPHGRYLLVGAGLSGGDAYAWVERTARSWLAELGVERSPAEIYAVLNRLAAEADADCGGLTCEPLFRGSRQRPTARASFSGVSADNFTLGNVARAVLQGIVDGLYGFYEAAGDRRPQASRIIATGNALRANPLLPQLLAQRFRLPVVRPVHEEEAAYGAALLGGVSAGLWPDLETAGARIRHEDLADPR